MRQPVRSDFGQGERNWFCSEYMQCLDDVVAISDQKYCKRCGNKNLRFLREGKYYGIDIFICLVCGHEGIAKVNTWDGFDCQQCELYPQELKGAYVRPKKN